MARSSNQKLKLIYLLKILNEHTDEKHALSAAELIERLKAYDVSAERKSIYSDIEALQNIGYDIIKSRGKDNSGFYMASRDFELTELKLLVDAVSSSRFITEKKSKELIAKLEKLCSKHEASALSRQVFVSDRVKTDNESIYYVVDGIHEAILLNSKISFHYSEWDENKELKLRRNGEAYVVSPYLLVWTDENYYLVAYENDKGIRHYRVDKMSDLTVLNEKREGRSEYRSFSPGSFAKKNFAMFAGEETTVTIECDPSLVGVMIDRFGKGISIRKVAADKIRIRTDVVVSPMFFGWLAGLRGQAKIVSPEDVRKEACEYMENIVNSWNQT